MKETLKQVMMLVLMLALGWTAMASVEYGWPDSVTGVCGLGMILVVLRMVRNEE